MKLPLLAGGALIAGFIALGEPRLVPSDAALQQIASSTVADAPSSATTNVTIALTSQEPEIINFAGAYLASQFAQRQQKWDDAARYLSALKNFHPEEPAVLKKELVLQMGADNPEAAIAAAQELLKMPDQDDASLTLANLFAITGAFKDEDYARARNLLETMPAGGLTLFMKPLLDGWLGATENQFDIKAMRSHALLMLHGVYMADYMGRTKEAVALLDGLSGYTDLPLSDIERIADIYMHLGETDKAHTLFTHLASVAPTNNRFQTKMLAYDPALSTYKTVKNAAEGLARAYYDMAHVLYQDHSDDSARIFAHMALYLQKDMSEAHILLGAIATRFNDYEGAISHYYAVPEGDPYFLEARREAASLYEDANLPDRSIAVLKELYNDYADLASLIKIGDVQRRQNDFSGALKTYSKALDHMGGTVPPDMWHLYYVRGMALEQLGQWELAYRDFETALSYQPNHPFLLNYFGYALADRGLDLDRALGMLQKAMALEPRDGYITDSVGWVYYQLKQYDQAVSHLEKAAELLPSDSTINEHLGDAYWRVGRKLEARYQWIRAKGFSDNTTQIAALNDKIANGPNDVMVIEAAQSGSMKKMPYPPD